MEDQIFTPQETPTLDDVMNTEQADVEYTPLDNVIDDEIHTLTNPSDVQIPESQEIETGEPIEVTIEDQIITPKKNRIDFQGYELDNISEADNENDVPSIKQVRDIVEEVESEKQDKLTAGDNITITNNVISATDTTYTAGDNITISDNVISATDTTYTAGSGLTLTDTEFSVGSITNSMIGASAVNTNEIADNAVTSAKIDWNTIRVSLFSGTDSGGSSGTIELSEDPANFTYLEIYFKDDQNFVNYAKVYNNKSNTTQFTITNVKASAVSETIFMVTKRYNLSSSGIVRGLEKVATIGNGTNPVVGSNNQLRIISVIGIK